MYTSAIKYLLNGRREKGRGGEKKGELLRTYNSPYTPMQRFRLREGNASGAIYGRVRALLHFGFITIS